MISEDEAVALAQRHFASIGVTASVTSERHVQSMLASPGNSGWQMTAIILDDYFGRLERPVEVNDSTGVVLLCDYYA